MSRAWQFTMRKFLAFLRAITQGRGQIIRFGRKYTMHGFWISTSPWNFRFLPVFAGPSLGLLCCCGKVGPKRFWTSGGGNGKRHFQRDGKGGEAPEEIQVSPNSRDWEWKTPKFASGICGQRSLHRSRVTSSKNDRFTGWMVHGGAASCGSTRVFMRGWEALGPYGAQSV